MRQRLGIARALVNEPAVVFLDEPTLGLDPSGQRQMLALIRQIAETRGATVVLSTHLLAEVEEVCGRVVILNRGRNRCRRHRSRRSPAAPGHRGRGACRCLRRPRPKLSKRFENAAFRPRRNSRPGELDLPLRADNADEDVRAALGALLDANIPVLGLELEGGRLSDAFLAMTERG